MNFDEFSAVRKRKQGARNEATEVAPAADTRDAPGMSVNGFLGSRGFQIVVILGVLVECALMPLSLARLDVWVRFAAECGVYIVVVTTLVELILAAVSVERLRALIFADAIVQLALALALMMRFGLEYPVIAWVPFLRGVRVFECISFIDETWQRLLEAAEAESRDARQHARELGRLLEEAASAARREDETNLRLKEALDMKAAEAEMLHEALTVAAEQQQEWQERFGVSVADGDGGRPVTSGTTGRRAGMGTSRGVRRPEAAAAAATAGGSAAAARADAGESTDDDGDEVEPLPAGKSSGAKRRTFVVGENM